MGQLFLINLENDFDAVVGAEGAVSITSVLCSILDLSACKKMGEGRGGHQLVRMEWRPARWSVCLPLLIFPCTYVHKVQKFSSGTGSPG